MGVLSVMGPRSREFLQSLTPDDLSNAGFPFATSRIIELGYALVRASRITYVGELGWELYVPTEFMQGVYDELLSAGRPSGSCMPAIMRSIRCASRRPTGTGVTTSPTRTRRWRRAFGFAVKLDKPGGFIGREALLRQKASGLAKRLVQFQLKSPEPLLYHNEPVWQGDALVGLHPLGHVRDTRWAPPSAWDT